MQEHNTKQIKFTNMHNKCKERRVNPRNVKVICYEELLLLLSHSEIKGEKSI
jgi:hypothetical protein